MTWLAIGRLLLSIVDKVAGYFRDRQLINAGRALERDRLSTEERDRMDAANRARLDAGGVFVDPFDAANRSGVQGTEADLVRQPDDTGGPHRSAS